MDVLPDLICLNLCNRIEVNPATGEYSLIGLFHSRRFASFPAVAPEFRVYAALYGGTGEGRITLAVSRAETEEVVYSKQLWRAFPGHGLVSNFETAVQACVFPAAGRYFVTLWFEDRILTHRVLDVFQE